MWDRIPLIIKLYLKLFFNHNFQAASSLIFQLSYILEFQTHHIFYFKRVSFLSTPILNIITYVNLFLVSHCVKFGFIPIALKSFKATKNILPFLTLPALLYFPSPYFALLSTPFLTSSFFFTTYFSSYISHLHYFPYFSAFSLTYSTSLLISPTLHA